MLICKIFHFKFNPHIFPVSVCVLCINELKVVSSILKKVGGWWAGRWAARAGCVAASER